MALLTGGSSTTTVLDALAFNPGDPAPHDVGSLANLIMDDQNPKATIMPTAFSYTGLLFVPNRGVLRCLKGDYVMVDPVTGWPILVSGAAVTGGSFVHS